MNWPIPKDVADIRSFTGFTDFYQKFMPNYANILAPISALLRKDIDWTWGEAQRKAFETVIQKLAQSTTLANPDVGKPFHVHTDASDTALGATLSQDDEKGEMRLVACMSKDAQRRRVQLPRARKGNAGPRYRPKMLASLPLGRSHPGLHVQLLSPLPEAMA